ncbi:MAG TPA: cytochrome b N-terminal domain-containing protein [Fimbriimonadaceae bacterium]|nr:cytochrome b N-terminal domain-containing protein [Fimbriimonadaceae bacterium]
MSQIPNEEKTGTKKTFVETVKQSLVWRSIFTKPYPRTDRERSEIAITSFWFHLHPSKIKAQAIKFNCTYCLGGLSAALFLILTVTGVLLMFYYVPSVERAHADMVDLQTAISLGKIVRNVHRWGAHAMVVVVFLHMIRVFVSKAYKHPREFNWVVGVILLVLTFFLSFTGYLLPWDQLAFWAVTVGTNMAGAVPFAGADIRFVLLGGATVDQPALLRFYVLHCVAVPLVMVALIVYHLWRVRKDGFSGGL